MLIPAFYDQARGSIVAGGITFPLADSLADEPPPASLWPKAGPLKKGNRKERLWNSGEFSTGA